MKTAISLPDALFRRTDRLARSEKISRSALIRRALEAYLGARASDVTQGINAVLDQIGADDESDAWVRAASTHALGRKY
jgi:metal-responsive CopG/Arc/MetJ family transcriptional regulator